MLKDGNDIIRIWPDIKIIFSLARSQVAINRQVKALGERFGVSPSLFI